MTLPLWRSDRPLVLASGSATRRTVLEAAGVPVTVHAANVDERGIEAELQATGASPSSVAAHLARAKATAVAPIYPGALVLGADQTLALGDRVFSKPATLQEARQHLQLLSGQTHQLHSAICLVHDGRAAFETCSDALLTMRDLSGPFLDAYLAAEQATVCASVGGYRFEGLGAHLFSRVEGDHFTILGLPLLALLPALRQLGYLLG